MCWGRSGNTTLLDRSHKIGKVPDHAWHPRCCEKGTPIGVDDRLPVPSVQPFSDKQIDWSTFRRPGGDRDRERAAVRRGAGAYARSFGIAAAADRDCRRAQGHQPLDVRSCRRCSTRWWSRRLASAKRKMRSSCCVMANSIAVARLSAFRPDFENTLRRRPHPADRGTESPARRALEAKQFTISDVHRRS